MKQEIISILLEKTATGELKWTATSSVTMFKTRDGSHVYSIEKRRDSAYEIVEWEANGKIPEPTIYRGGEAERLYEKILELNPEFEERLEEVGERKPIVEVPDPVSLLKIKKQLGLEKEGANEFINIKDCDSFFYVKEAIPNYVEPLFVKLETYGEDVPIDKAEVILISAPGATGKSALSAYLSDKMGLPLFDLGKHNAVAANSLTGLFVNYLPIEEYVRFMNGLTQNRFSMIIDGLDEGEIRSGGMKAYWSFLDDIVNIAKHAEGTPFLMLGRQRTVMDTAFYLENNGVRVVCLQIEPFTLAKAQEFIDKSIENKDSAIRFEKSYLAVRKYIIDSIEGFFKDEGELKRQSFNRFIGYAPVLMAIASLLDEKQDYNKLLNELQSEKKSNIDLIINIIERILIRERGKARSLALPAIFDTSDMDSAFKEEIQGRAYNIDEQCARIMHKILHKPYNYRISDREDFNHSYNERLEMWSENHPFIDNKNPQEPRFQNIVFESYVVAQLAKDDKYSQMLVEYLELTKSNSYLLFDFYDRLADENRYLSHQLIGYMYDSFRALDSSKGTGFMEIISTTEENELYDNLAAYCDLSFYREGQLLDLEKEFKTKIPVDEVLVLPSSLRGIIVDIPLPVVCNTPRLDIMSPMSIRCKKMSITSADVVVSSDGVEDIVLETAVIECDEFFAQQNDGNLPHVITRGNDKILKIMAGNMVRYPFSDYYRGHPAIIQEDPELSDKFQKLRRTILFFRASGKENLARIQDKIESRISNTVVGKAVVDRLRSTGIIYTDNKMYVLNTEEMNRQLGMSYNDFHSGEINQKTRDYLEKIRV